MHSSNSSCLWSGVYCPQPVLAAISHYPRKSELFFYYYFFFFLIAKKIFRWAMHSEPPALQAESWVSVSNSFTEQLFQFTLLFCSVEAVRDLSLLHPAPFYHIPYHCWWHFWWFFLKGELIHDIAKKPSQVTNRIIMENIYKLWLKIHMQAFLFYLLFFTISQTAEFCSTSYTVSQNLQNFPGVTVIVFYLGW